MILHGRDIGETHPEDSDQAASANLIVVQHWTEELKRLVPTQ